MAMVDLPLAERPVNHNVKPFWARRALRSGCVTEEACQVMLLKESWDQRMIGIGWEKGQTRTYVAIVGWENKRTSRESTRTPFPQVFYISPVLGSCIL